MFIQASGLGLICCSHSRRDFRLSSAAACVFFTGHCFVEWLLKIRRFFLPPTSLKKKRLAKALISKGSTSTPPKLWLSYLVRQSVTAALKYVKAIQWRDKNTLYHPSAIKPAAVYVELLIMFSKERICHFLLYWKSCFTGGTLVNVLFSWGSIFGASKYQNVKKKSGIFILCNIPDTTDTHREDWEKTMKEKKWENH